MKFPALALSFLFHPLLLISLGAFLIFRLDMVYNVAISEKALLIYQAVVFIGTFLFPLNTIFILQKLLKNETSLFMEERQDRRLPLLISAIFILITFYVFTYKVGHLAPHLLRGFLLGTAASVMLASVINNWYKISLHAIGMGGIAGLLIFMQGQAIIDLRGILAAWLLISGLVLSARVFLGAHSPGQTYTGYLTGMVLIYIIVRI